MTLTVCLDPGHGGDDTGAMWPSFVAPAQRDGEDVAAYAERRNEAHRLAVERAELVEADVALELGLGLQYAIERLDWPVAVVLTRDILDVDSKPDFSTRAALAAKAGADLVLSIHVNASDDGARGLMTFVRREDKTADAIAADIMRCAPRPLLRSSKLPEYASPDGWTSRAYRVLHRHERPAVLVEAGFLTSDTDRGVLCSSSGRDAVIVALLAGVARLRMMREH